jgi:hypothetical protein
LVPVWRQIFNSVAFAVIHALPALAPAGAAIFVTRADPFTRPLLAALMVIVLGSANAVAVMGEFFGKPLLYCGVVAAFIALRPRTLPTLGTAAGAAGLLGYSALQMNVALAPVLLAESSRFSRFHRVRDGKDRQVQPDQADTEADSPKQERPYDEGAPSWEGHGAPHTSNNSGKHQQAQDHWKPT